MSAIQSLIVASLLSVNGPDFDHCALPSLCAHGVEDASARDAMVLAHAEHTVHMVLDELGVDGETHARIKAPDSLRAKALRKGLMEEDVLDRLAMRVVVDHEAQCHAVATALLNRVDLVVGSHDDYIRHPKANGYQSLHMALYAGPAGEVVEVQVRTAAMHARAEHGAAAHQHYKAAQAA